MKALVGFTGFVGSNLADTTDFDGLYNSKNIAEAYDTKPDLLIYAGVPAAKYLANKAPEEDLAVIRQAEENIAKIAPKKLVLISTIDVFPDPVGVNEKTVPGVSNEAYGRHRLELEIWTRKYYPDALIIRLPALFGKNLKKNFIYDLMHPIPFRLTEKLFADFGCREPRLQEYYHPCGNGFLQRIEMDAAIEDRVKEIFGRLGFSALHFTDSRNVYQFYPIARLWQDIETAMKNDLQIFHTATEPVSAGELYDFLTGNIFVNETMNVPVKYDYKTCYGELFGGAAGYIMDKKAVMREIKRFVNKG